MVWRGQKLMKMVVEAEKVKVRFQLKLNKILINTETNANNLF